MFFSLYPNLPQNFLPFGKDVPLSQVLHFSRKCSHRCEYQAPIASGHGGVAWGSIPSVLIDCLFWGAFSRLDLENIQSLWGGRKKKYLLPAWSLSMVPSSLLFQATTVLQSPISKFCSSRFLLTSSWDWDTPKTLLKDKGANTFPYPFLTSSDPASV